MGTVKSAVYTSFLTECTEPLSQALCISEAHLWAFRLSQQAWQPGEGQGQENQ